MEDSEQRHGKREVQGAWLLVQGSIALPPPLKPSKACAEPCAQPYKPYKPYSKALYSGPNTLHKPQYTPQVRCTEESFDPFVEQVPRVPESFKVRGHRSYRFTAICHSFDPRGQLPNTCVPAFGSLES